MSQAYNIKVDRLEKLVAVLREDVDRLMKALEREKGRRKEPEAA